MKLLGQALCIAFSMYSAIPTPQVEWNQQNMKYALCFFPLVGIVVGAAMALWLWFCSAFGIGPLLLAAGAVALPLLLTGGIHVDGFCDTVDALSSHTERERKLEILKDSHIGAFALIGSLVYFVLNLGLWSEVVLTKQTVACLAVGYVFSRSLSGFSIVHFQCARNSGLARTFADGAAKRKVKVTMAIYLLICCAALLLIHWQLALVMLVCGAITFVYYRQMSYRQFGGITGDLAGYFLQLCELALLLAVVVSGRILL